MVEPGGKNLVFLLSTPRAGSTLLAAMLGNHSKILCPNEPWLLLSLYNLFAAQRTGGASHDQKKASQALREWLSEGEFGDACRAFAVTAYNLKLVQARKLIFMDKTPRYYHILPFIDRLFPESKKIWLKRNPLDVAASFRSTWKTSMAELVGEELSPFSFDLTLSLLNFTRFFQGQDHTFEVRYEDLVRQPREILGQLCDFLQVAPEPGLEDYGAHSSNLHSLKQRTMGDKKIFAHTQPHGQSVDRWQTVLSRRDAQKLLDCIGAGFFERMGYGDTVRDLRQRFKFPSQSRVERNLLALEQASDSFGQAVARGRHKPGKTQPRTAPSSYWWQKLGERVGIGKGS